MYKYETYVEILRNAIALRVKKQGERKLERSLVRSMASLSRRTSEQTDTEGDERVYGGRSGLRIDPNRKMIEDDEEEKTPSTPMAAKSRDVGRV